jgi:hypothetical protein
MTVFFNNKKRPIYEDPVKQNYYILNTKGKRRLAKPKVGFILNKGLPRAVTSRNIPNIPVNLRHKRISSVNVTNALLEAQKALGACKSQRTANAAASAALQTAAVTNNQNKIKNAANIAVNHSKNNPGAPSAQSANAGFMGALAVAGKTLLPLATGMPNISPAKQEKVANAVNNAVVKAGNNSPNVVNAATKAAVQTLSGNLSQLKENIAMIKASQAAANAAAKHGNGANAANAASQAAIIVAQSPNATPAKIEKAANAAANAVASGANTPAVAAANAAAAANANKPAAAVNAAAKMNTKNNLNKLLNQYNANRTKAFKKFSLKAHPNKGGNANYFQKVSALYTTHYKNVNEANVAAKQANENAKAAANAAQAEVNKAAANAAAKAANNAAKAAANAAAKAAANAKAANNAAKAQAEANAKAANNAAKAAKEAANAKAANNAAKAKAAENAKAANNAAKAAQEAANKAAANAAEAAKTKNAENKAAANAAAKAAQNAANKAAANAKEANKLAFNALPGTSLFNNKAQANFNAIAKAKANANAKAAAKVNIPNIPGKPNPYNSNNNVVPAKIPNTPLNNGALRALKKIYKFPAGATTNNRIKQVSEDVLKQFLVAKRGTIMPDQAAWLILKSRGRTVGEKNYKSGFIMNQYNWKNLYKNTNNASQKQVMRYILAMLALNPPYANRKTGDRNKLTNNTIAYMNNANFNAYLNKVRPVANQGGGLVKAALRTTVSGAGLAAKHAKPFVLPVAGMVLVSQLANPALAGPAMSKLKQIIKDRLKEKLKNIPYSNQLVNKLSNAAEKKLAGMKGATNNKVINSIETTINTGIKNDRKVNTAVETFVRQQRNIGNINYGEVAKYKNFIRQAIKNGTFNATKAANNYQKKKLAGQLTGLAIASGALAAEGAVGMVGKKVVKGATGNGQRMAAEAAQRIAEKGVKSRVAINLNKAKMNFIKKQLNRAARGETIPANVINKAIQRAGGNARIGHALEKGGQAALNLLKSL